MTEIWGRIAQNFLIVTDMKQSLWNANCGSEYCGGKQSTWKEVVYTNWQC